MFDVTEFLAEAHKARRFSEGSLERAIIAAGVKAVSVDAAHKRAMRAAAQAGWWTRDGRTYHRPLEQEMPRAAVVLLKNMREGGKVRREQIERALELAGVPDPVEERIHVVSRMLREGWTTKDGVTFHAPRPPKPAKAERPAPPPCAVHGRRPDAPGAAREVLGGARLHRTAGAARMTRRELAILAALALVAAFAGYVLAEALSVAFLGLPLSVRRVP